jgi:hypothetical protein
MVEIPSKLFPKPASFGTEPLSQFMDAAINNIFTTYCHKSDWYHKFLRLDEAFYTAFVNVSTIHNTVFGLLLGRAHGGFRGACMMTMSGYPVEPYILMRGCIEASLYALHIEANDGLADIWLNRHDDEKSEAACRDSFRYGALKRTLKARSQKHYETMANLYERAIDLGAHPNERSVTDNIDFVKDGNKQILSLKYIVGDSQQLEDALKTTSEVGTCALRILQLARPYYFKQLGIDAIIDEVTEGKLQSDAR